MPWLVRRVAVVLAGCARGFEDHGSWQRHDRQKATGTVQQDRASALSDMDGMRVVEVDVEDDGRLTV